VAKSALVQLWNSEALFTCEATAHHLIYRRDALAATSLRNRDELVDCAHFANAANRMDRHGLGSRHQPHPRQDVIVNELHAVGDGQAVLEKDFHAVRAGTRVENNRRMPFFGDSVSLLKGTSPRHHTYF